MMWQSVGLTVLVIVATLLCVLLFMLFGWYVVWQLFLSKFKFLRELLGEAGTPPAETHPSEPHADRLSAATSATTTTPTATAAGRSRPRSARQRVTLPAEHAS